MGTGGLWVLWVGGGLTLVVWRVFGEIYFGGGGPLMTWSCHEMGHPAKR
jgi:hypothetical protein